MLGLTLSITRRGSMPAPCPFTPTCQSLPQICAVYVPEDLARYATGRGPLSYNAQAGASAVVPEVTQQSHKRIAEGEPA